MKSASQSCKSWLWVLILFFAWTPATSEAQVGRFFYSLESLVGSARIVYVGEIITLEPVEYDKALTDTQKIGKPYRVVFKVSETIRGEEVDQIELILSLQITWELEFLQERAAKIMLVGGPDYYRRDLSEIGIEAQGKPATDEWFQFQLLEPVEDPEDEEAAKIAENAKHVKNVKHINGLNDSWRLFTNEFTVVQGSEKILKRARAFVEEHPKRIGSVSVRIPNEVGAKCGDPNAYCSIVLPICPSTLHTLDAIKKDPTDIMGDVETYEAGRGELTAKEIYEWNRETMLKSIDKAIDILKRKVAIKDLKTTDGTDPSKDDTPKTATQAK